MGEIKSALELALERTSNVQSDKKVMLKNNAVEEGRKIAFKYLEDSSATVKIIEESLKHADKEKQEWLKEGILKVIFNNLKLPENETSFEKIEKIKNSIMAITKNKKEITIVFEQANQIFAQYLQHKSSIKENLDNNFSKKLQEKEQLLSQQLGKEIHLNMEVDPEYNEYLRKMTAQLDEQYHEIIVKIKNEIEKRV
jgi:hypothetical protein